MSKCKIVECAQEARSDRLYCSTHNESRIRELGGNPIMGRFKGAVFVKRPDYTDVIVPAPKNDKYYQDNKDYSEEDGQSD